MQCPPCTRLLLTRPSTPTLGHKLALIWRSTPAPAFVVPVTRVPATPGRFESARKELRSSCVSGGWRDQQFDQGPEQRLAALPHIVHELEEAQIER